MRKTGLIQENKIIVNVNGIIRFIEILDIIHIKCSGTISIIQTISNNERIIMTRLLKEFEDELTPKGFVRVHHSALANIKNIKSYNRKMRRILFINDETCYASVRKSKTIMELLN